MLSIKVAIKKHQDFINTHFILSFFAFCLLMFSAMLTKAESQPSTLTFGTVDNFPPFAYMKKNELVGVDIDIVNAIAKRLNINIRYVVFPWARVISSLKNGTIDGGFSAFETEARKKFCHYVGILHYESFYLFVKQGNEFSYNGIKDLYGKTIGKDYGVFISKVFDEAVSQGNIKLHQVSDRNMINIKKLSAGRIDAAIGDLGVMQYYIELLDISTEVIPLSPIQPSKPAYLVLSKMSEATKSSSLMNNMKSELIKLWRDGFYEKAINRHTTGQRH